QDQRRSLFGRVSGPQIQRVDAKAFAERVRGERRAAEVRSDEPGRVADRADLIGLPLAGEARARDLLRHAARFGGRHEMNDGAAAGRLRDDRWLVTADLLDVRREKGGGLCDSGVLAWFDDDFADSASFGKDDVAGLDATVGAHPRSANGLRPFLRAHAG